MEGNCPATPYGIETHKWLPSLNELFMPLSRLDSASWLWLRWLSRARRWRMRKVTSAAQGPKELPTNRPFSSGPIVVAVVLGSSGTVGSDVLAPYEVFSSSPDFSVYTIAAQSAPAPIDGGPAIVPTYTFEDISSGRARPPDVVVVPAVGARKPQCASGSWSNQAAGRTSWESATDRASLPGLAS